MKIQPIDIEALEREKKPWPLEYIAAKWAETWSDYLGREYIHHLTPKDPEGLERRGR